MRAELAVLAAALLALGACARPTGEAAKPAEDAAADRAAAPAKPPVPPPLPESVRVELELVPGLHAVELTPPSLRRTLAPEAPDGVDVSALPPGEWKYGRAPLTNTESIAFAVSADRKVLWFDGNRDERFEPGERHDSPRPLGSVHWHERLETVSRREIDGILHEEPVLLAVGAQFPPGQLAFSRLDCHLQGVLEAGGRSARIAVVDRTFRGYFNHAGRDVLLVDVDGDGQFTRTVDSHERYRLGEAIPLGPLDLIARQIGPLGRTLDFAPSPKIARRMPPLTVGHPAPEIEAVALDGSAVRLSEHQGSWVLVDFWATWCGPCLRELPHLKSLVADNPELVILGISGDRQRAALERFLERDPLPWTQVYDANAVLRRDWRIQQLPTNYLIAPDGRIAGKNLRGASLDARFEGLVKSWKNARGPEPSGSLSRAAGDSRGQGS